MDKKYEHTENDRKQAHTNWNRKAAFYDKSRPDYPKELITTIIGKTNLKPGSKVLEIGAGSGKATAQFADYGLEMLCIEPGADLAEKGIEMLKDKNVKFIVSTFEDYPEPAEYFDAIISAQAFHWVSQPIGYQKCANALKEGGHLAMFWHLDLFRRDVELDKELWAIINKYSGWVSCMPEEDYGPRMESIASKIAGSGLFSKPEIIHFYMEKFFTADEYYNYMLTGGLFDLPDAEKQNCHEELTQLAEKYNDIKRNLTFELYLTQKIS